MRPKAAGRARGAGAARGRRPHDRAHAHALYVGAALAASQSDYAQARQMLETCLALRRRLGNGFDIAATLSTLSMARLPPATCSARARASTRRCRSSASSAIASARRSACCTSGRSSLDAGDVERARTHLDDCLTLSRAIKHQEVEGECELVLGELALEADDIGGRARALPAFADDLPRCRRQARRGACRWWLGKADCAKANSTPPAAASTRRCAPSAPSRCARTCWRLGDWAALAAAEGRTDAFQMAAAVDRAPERLALRRTPRGAQQWKAFVALLRAAVDPAAFDEAWAVGARWEIDDAAKAS